MTDPVSPFDKIIQKIVEDAKRIPPEDVDSPNFELYNVLSKDTDKAMTDDYFRRYRHLFCMGDGTLHSYRKDIGEWDSQGIQQRLYSLCMQLSGTYYDSLAVVKKEIEDGRASGADVEALTRRQVSLQKMIKHCEKGSTVSMISKMLYALLVTVLSEKPVKMNPDSSILACKNGVMELKTGTLRAAHLKDYITLNTGVNYNDKADVTWWEDAVLAMCGGDKALAEFLQVWCGYSLTGYTNEHCMAILWGMGRNGKSLLVDALRVAMGGYASALPAGFLESTGADSSMDNNMIYAMARLHGVRMAHISETGEKGKMRESWVKSQTGDMNVSARLPYQGFIEFQLTHKLFVGTNHKPEIAGTDDGVWERIRMVPMRVRFGTQEEIDSGIAQALSDPGLLARTASAEGKEAVLRWAVAGAGKYLQNGLRKYTPAVITTETLGYRREQDVLGQFLQSSTEWVNPIELKRVKEIESNDVKIWREMSLNDKLRVEKQEFWNIYSVWCDEHGHHVMSATMFARRVTSAQRWWQANDGGADKVMPVLDGLKSNNAYFYRYLRLSENGNRMRLASIAMQNSRKPKNHGENDI